MRKRIRTVKVELVSSSNTVKRYRIKESCADGKSPAVKFRKDSVFSVTEDMTMSIKLTLEL